jgi:hypothetical protein
MATPQPVVIRPLRGYANSSGGIILQATITPEESAEDKLTITKHPVEYQAAITDHAYIEPPQVVLRQAWSLSDANANNNPAYLSGIYQQLLALQKSRVPFTLFTGKRMYATMLIASLSQVTDEDTENCLFITVACQQILVVSVQAITVNPSQVAPASAPSSQTVQNGGAKQLINQTFGPPVATPSVWP